MDKKAILKHRKVFNAWLNGEEIETPLTKGRGWTTTLCPKWLEFCDYRVKPRILYRIENSSGDAYTSHFDKEFVEDTVRMARALNWDSTSRVVTYQVVEEVIEDE